jgi:hypothetical protein
MFCDNVFVLFVVFLKQCLVGLLIPKQKEAIPIFKLQKINNRSENVIRNFLTLGHKYGIKANNCSVGKISALQRGRIRHEASRNRSSARQIVDTLS